MERHKFGSPLLYGISCRRLFQTIPEVTYLELLFQTRAHVIQWREKDLSRERNRFFTRKGVELAEKLHKLFLVNTDIELALEEQADGVHLTSTQELANAIDLRSQSGIEKFLVGKSVHSLAEVVKAESEGADYLLLAPIFPPISKKSDSEVLGLETLRRAVAAVSIPVLALGGMSDSNCQAAIFAGAAGVAGISWINEEVRRLVKARSDLGN